MEGPEDEVIASDWAAGFLDAVSLRPKAWEPLIAHDRAGIMIMPILLLSGDAAADLAHPSWTRTHDAREFFGPISFRNKPRDRKRIESVEAVALLLIARSAKAHKINQGLRVFIS